MSVIQWLGRSACVVALAAVMLTGCRSMESLTANSDGIAEKRRARSQAAVQRFDRKRDWADFQFAQARRDEGDLADCIETLKRLLARNPDHLEARLLIAEALLGSDRPDDAVVYLEPALAGHPDDARVHHLMGLLLDATGRPDDALVFRQRAAALQAGGAVYQASYQALAESEAPSRELAPGAEPLPFPTPVPLPADPEPSSPESFPAVPEARARSDRRPAPPAALPEIPSPWGVDSPNSTPHDSASRSGSLAEQPPSLPRAVVPGEDRPLGPDGAPDPGRSEVGEFFISDEEPIEKAEGAGPVGGEGPAGDPAVMSAVALVQKGRSAIAEGRDALGFAYFREAMELRPDDPHVPTAAAVCALRHNQPDLAVSLLKPCLDAFPESVAVRRILATAHYRLGDYRSSQVVLRQALSLDNSSALSYFLMGCTLVKLGQPAVAETYFRQARRLDPRYASGP
jgi:Flp pilus assembly protein TadD